jgi:hypothetical protein
MATVNQESKKKMSNGKKILIGVGVIVLIGLIGSQLEAKNEKSNPNSENNKLPPAQAEKEDIAKNTVTAKDLTASYEANEVNADETYKGKMFYVSGIVTDIKKDMLGDIYVTLEGDQTFRQVQCYFDNKETASKLSKGMNVTFKGKCDGLMMNVLMKDCELTSVN